MNLTFFLNKILPFLFLAVAIAYFIKRLLPRAYVSGFHLSHIVIVGINKRSLEFIEELEGNPKNDLKIIGFVDDDSVVPREDLKYPIISSLENFEEYLRYNIIDETAIFLPVKSQYSNIERIIKICREHGITVRYSGNLFDETESSAKRFISRNIDNFHMVSLLTGNIHGWKTILKRLMDIVGSCLGIIILSPLLLFVFVWIKIVSPGPAIFVQNRVGLNKRDFKLFKFRTMVIGAENMIDDLENHNEATGPVFKLKNDPRIIPTGSFLRKTSIDELPQLFNVLLGNMSLVGPRPLPIRDYSGFYKDWHRRRFSVKPGITCLWQIQGRNEIGFEEWMKLDLEYIDNWTLWLDIKILMGTVIAVLKFSRAS